MLGDEAAVESTMAGLRSAAAYIRRQLAASVNLRNTPEIIFIADQSIEHGVMMSKKIDEVIEKDDIARLGREEDEEE